LDIRPPRPAPARPPDDQISGDQAREPIALGIEAQATVALATSVAGSTARGAYYSNGANADGSDARRSPLFAKVLTKLAISGEVDRILKGKSPADLPVQVP
jgi:hypothetical protein